jgi:hypothetical protein
MPALRKSSETRESDAAIGCAGRIWLAVDKLRNNMDAAKNTRAERDGLRASKYGTLIHRVQRDLSEGLPFGGMVRRRTVEMDAPLAESVKMESAMRTNLNGLNSTP